MNTKINSRINSLKELELKADELQKRQKDIITISVCSGTACQASADSNLYTILCKEIKKYKKSLDKEVFIRRSGCHGYCERGPLVVIYPQEICYLEVKKKDIPEIVEKTLKNEVIERLLFKNETVGTVVKEYDIPFYRNQRRIILQGNADIDSKSIDDYIRIGGYKALAKVLEQMSPEEVLKEIKKSYLRGRGGAGFPTGMKWEFCKKAKSGDGVKYIVCNGDEGDPGAYMDRSILEGNPHSILEGIIIGAYTIGANQGYVYVRQEYPLAVENTKIAINMAKKYGFLGKNIFGSGFDFDIDIYLGAGAFVCGEETALLKSIEGKRGMPKPRPPFPANKGLYDKPTLINNVETFANIRHIILNGSKWYLGIGTDKSKGTKIFALTGAVKNIGLVEVPMGITLRDIVYKIGGGIKGDKKFKAVQIGGPSGGCIPEKYLDTPVDYERVKDAGAIMGSGGMVILDEDTCMVDLARFFMDFIQEESCGQCTPCRVGTRRMLEILERITQGKGEEGDIEKLEELGKMIKETSLCGLGKTAPNPVLSTIKYFREDYEEHIETKLSCKRLHRKEKVKKV